MLMVVFGEGVDCASEYLFDTSSGALVALLHTCDGFVEANCTAAASCVPERCMPNDNALYSTPASCPALPDASTD